MQEFKMTGKQHRPKENILDIGAGVDPERWFSGSCKIDINGIGYEPIDNEILDVNAREGLPFPDGWFDVVYVRHAITYMFDDTLQLRFLLSEIARVLKPQGTATIIDYPRVMNDDGEYEDISYEEFYDEHGQAIEYDYYMHGCLFSLSFEAHKERGGLTEFIWFFQKTERTCP